VFSVGWHTIVQYCDTTTRKLLQTRRNNTHMTIRELITMTNMGEQRTLTR